MIINTIPAHVLGDAALEGVPRDTPIIELASAPYGLDMQKAVKLGLRVCVRKRPAGAVCAAGRGRSAV